MSEQRREWDDSVVWVADELVSRHGAEDAIDELRERRTSGDKKVQRRCEEAIAWIRREVIGDE